MTRQKSLSESFRPDPGDPALDTTRPPQAPPDEPLVTVYVVNGTRTSQGPGPGVKQLPPEEASALIRQRFAVYGSKPPNVPDPEPVAKPFTGTHDPFPPRAGTRSGISN
jgi:hypothetical protein